MSKKIHLKGLNMSKFIATTLMLIPMLLFAGCTSYWYQEGKTYSEGKGDLRECQSEMQKYSDKSWSMGLYDFKFEEECMKQKGYRLVKERDLPLRVKRQGPDTSAGEKHGMAGTLEGW